MYFKMIFVSKKIIKSKCGCLYVLLSSNVGFYNMKTHQELAFPLSLCKIRKMAKVLMNITKVSSQCKRWINRINVHEKNIEIYTNIEPEQSDSLTIISQLTYSLSENPTRTKHRCRKLSSHKLPQSRTHRRLHCAISYIYDAKYI